MQTVGQIPLIEKEEPADSSQIPEFTEDEFLKFANLFGSEKMPRSDAEKLLSGIREFLPTVNQSASGYDRRRRKRLRDLLNEMEDIDPKKNRLLRPKEILEQLQRL